MQKFDKSFGNRSFSQSSDIRNGFYVGGLWLIVSERMTAFDKCMQLYLITYVNIHRCIMYGYCWCGQVPTSIKLNPPWRLFYNGPYTSHKVPSSTQGVTRTASPTAVLVEQLSGFKNAASFSSSSPLTYGSLGRRFLYRRLSTSPSPPPGWRGWGAAWRQRGDPGPTGPPEWAHGTGPNHGGGGGGGGGGGTAPGGSSRTGRAHFPRNIEQECLSNDKQWR